MSLEGKLWGVLLFYSWNRRVYCSLCYVPLNLNRIICYFYPEIWPVMLKIISIWDCLFVYKDLQVIQGFTTRLEHKWSPCVHLPKELGITGACHHIQYQLLTQCTWRWDQVWQAVSGIEPWPLRLLCKHLVCWDIPLALFRTVLKVTF